MQLSFGNKSKLVEISVHHPMAKSYVKEACTGPGKIAEKFAKVKVVKYTELISQQNVTTDTEVIPITCETLGGICEQGRQLIKDIGFTAKESSNYTSGEIIVYLQGAIGCAIARGNSNLIKLYYTNTTEKTLRKTMVTLKKSNSSYNRQRRIRQYYAQHVSY